MFDNYCLGKNGFFWFTGVVEDRNDPMKLGRIRVRVLGIHTDDKTQIKTEDLPWAFPLQPITSASMNGVGQTPIGPVEGTWVVGFFRDGDNCQEPIIMGTLGGVPQLKSDKNKGFNDPQGNYPKSDFLKEQDTNRLARNEEIEKTIVQQKKDGRKKDLKIYALDDKKTWSEPEPAYNAKYPYNKVYESESGHVIEIDDTPKANQDGKVESKGNERLHLYHRKGTFIEIQPDGSEVTKIVGNKHEIIVKDDTVYIQGSCAVYVQGDSSFVCNGNVKAEVGKDLDVQVKNGSATLIATKDIHITGTDNVNISVSKGDTTVSASSKVTVFGGEQVQVLSNKHVNVEGKQVDVKAPHEGSISISGKNISIDASKAGAIDVKATGAVSVNSSAGSIDLNALTSINLSSESINITSKGPLKLVGKPVIQGVV